MEEPQHRIDVSLEYAEHLALVRNGQSRLRMLAAVADLAPRSLGNGLDLEEGKETVCSEVPEGLVLFYTEREARDVGLQICLIGDPLVYCPLGQLNVEIGLKAGDVETDRLTGGCRTE
jgi:hypothetical protein